MGDSNIDEVPEDLNFNIDAYVNKYINEDDIIYNPISSLKLDSPYINTEQILNTLGFTNDKFNTHEYCSLHLNIQSLPAKFEKLKLLINKLSCQNIYLDFIMLCETFLTDNIAQQFSIPGYNFISKNRPNSARGGVAIYIKAEHNFIERDDIAINKPGVF